MRAVRWHGVGDVRLDEIEAPALQEESDAILRVTTAAICGSDLHVLHGKIPKVPQGMVIGHEFVGVVDAVGPGVSAFRPGQRVVSAMFAACGRCDACLAGRHARCRQNRTFGYGDLFGGLDGGQAEYVRVPTADTTLWAIPDGVPDTDVLFTGDILATAYTGCVEARIEHGDVVAVVGAGPVGLLAVQCAHLFAPAAVYAIDMVPDRLEQARRFGAVPIDTTAGDPLARLRELTGGRRATVVIEAVGSAGALETAWRIADAGGRIALVGVLTDEAFPQTAGQTWLRGLSVIPVNGQPIRYRERLAALVGAGRLDPAAVITETLPLDGAVEAYARLDRRETTKVVLEVSRP
ncbi:alcohol dehydrogenase catalytic domain-containing protein [Pseudonocardia bannensis]|uniref:alcohol dehydrogenase catalytic domain-containing protein n=1 Tax=Pseudonocardia bannensis TaxID=630973 RepID=UPI00146F3234|nr:alcohol dehydrogenase catalytic domain-containing protein [Pseudonocardia bannensis]